MNSISDNLRNLAKTGYYKIARKSYVQAYERLKEYTMIPRDTYIRNLILAERTAHIEGDVVECGTWKGGMIAGIALIHRGLEKDYHLFDSFEGLPKAKEIDGIAALKWQSDTQAPSYHNNCYADITHAQQAMKIAGIENPRIYKGWFRDTLPKFDKARKISLLRLDGDWYDSTMECLDNLFDQVVRGGYIMIDDYYTWDGCSRAVHDFLSTRKLSSRVRQFQNDICYIIK